MGKLLRYEALAGAAYSHIRYGKSDIHIRGIMFVPLPLGQSLIFGFKSRFEAPNVPVFSGNKIHF